jgi:NAD(P)-dependent dehydrogenase (short-subunit alcohol dehydrogenase family)
MVNNAGVETRTSVLDTTEEQYEKVLAINLKSAFFGTQLAARQMIKQGLRLDSRPDFFEGPRRIADIKGDNHIGSGTVLTSSIPTLAAA